MSDDERPDYVHCVKMPNAKVGWCGREISGGGTRGFFFTDIEHALLNGEQGGRLLLCPDCDVAICLSVRTASSGAEPVDVKRMDGLEWRWIYPNGTGGGEKPNPLTMDELTELQGMKRRLKARGEIDRALAVRKR